MIEAAQMHEPSVGAPGHRGGGELAKARDEKEETKAPTPMDRRPSKTTGGAALNATRRSGSIAVVCACAAQGVDGGRQQRSVPFLVCCTQCIVAAAHVCARAVGQHHAHLRSLRGRRGRRRRAVAVMDHAGGPRSPLRLLQEVYERV